MSERWRGLCAALALSPMIAAAPAAAKQVTGTPGSPSGTISGEQLPPPPQKFAGKIGRNSAQSKPYWPARVVPAKGAPNILLIMTDDVGFGAQRSFGANGVYYTVVPTP